MNHWTCTKIITTNSNKSYYNKSKPKKSYKNNHEIEVKRSDQSKHIFSYYNLHTFINIVTVETKKWYFDTNEGINGTKISVENTSLWTPQHTSRLNNSNRKFLINPVKQKELNSSLK